MSYHLDANDNVVIIGGGIAGLFSASVLLEEGFNNITILEKDSSIGGLLKSKNYLNPLGDSVPYSFDYGTHFVLKTGDENIDNILDQDLDKEDYHEFHDSLPEGQYINGQLYCDSGCANAMLFPVDLQNKIENELSALIKNPRPQNISNLKDLFLRRYGKIVTETIYEPAIKKFTGQDIETLDVVTETSFNSSRIILKNRDVSKKLKTDPYWDNVIAYGHYLDGHSDIKKYYPKKNGIDLWVKNIEKRLTLRGVKILKSSSVERIIVENDQLKTIEIGDSKKIDCDYMIWTLPPIFLAKMTGVEVPSSPPSIRTVSIVNIITDKKPVEGPYWLTIYDPNVQSFRVTLYDNFTEKPLKNGYRISVEVLHNGDYKGGEDQRHSIFNELKSMKILPDNASILWSNHELIPAGFPILKVGDRDVYDEQINILQKSFKNVFIVNRYRNNVQGQGAIMQNIYDTLNQFFQKMVA